MNWSSPCGRVSIYCGDFVDLLTNLPVPHAIVTDPPYGLAFMGKKWDYDVPSVDSWRRLYQLILPGTHLLSFSGTRTYHRMAVNIEDAGFEIRDMIAWVYGSGFPKSLDVSKAIDKAAGAERTEVIGAHPWAGRNGAPGGNDVYGAQTHAQTLTAPATDAARQWQGWGTALKPALEPIVVARKPLIGTVAGNVLEYGIGAINVDGCRVHLNGDYKCGANGRPSQTGLGDNYDPSKANLPSDVGRWPANLIHDGSEEVVELFPVTTSGATRRRVDAYPGKSATGFLRGETGPHNQHGDSGSAARFFYCAKASKGERGDGNNHPTVKPIELMRYLCRLVTPPNGVILDPFMGSGSTGIAAFREGFRFIGIEKDLDYFEIAKTRIQEALGESDVERI